MPAPFVWSFLGSPIPPVQFPCCPSIWPYGASVQGPFVSEGGLPVSRSVFSTHLLRACQLCGLDPSRYKGHSFRSDAASYAADRGLSDDQVRLLGRWQSDAFLRYIRVPSLSS